MRRASAATKPSSATFRSSSSADFVNDFDRIVLVDAPRPLRLERLTRERALGQTEAMNMIASQMPAELKRARADFVIDNDGEIGALEYSRRRSVARTALPELTAR